MCAFNAPEADSVEGPCIPAALDELRLRCEPSFAVEERPPREFSRALQ